MTGDKRVVCGCHIDCDEPAWWVGERPLLSHVCSGQCEWPACLTDAEHEELARELEEDML